MSKKPWIWPACRSMERKRSAPAAVIDAADARRAASIMISSSIRWSFTGVEVLWTRKTSRPRTFSAISIWISPSENLPTSQLPMGISRYSQMSFTRGLLEFPETPTSSDSVSGMRGLLQRAASAGLPASGRGGGRRGAARKLAVVLGEDHLLHPLAGFAVQRVGNVLEGSVLPALCRHGHEQAGISVDLLDAAPLDATRRPSIPKSRP